MEVKNNKKYENVPQDNYGANFLIVLITRMTTENNKQLSERAFETFSEIIWYFSNASPVVNKGSEVTFPRRSVAGVEGNGCEEAPDSLKWNNAYVNQKECVSSSIWTQTMKFNLLLQ